MTQTLRRDRDLALSRLKYEVAAFRFRLAMLDLDAVLAAEEVKYNPNHDPTTGRFTSGGGSFGGAGSSGGWSGRDPSRSNPDPGGVGVVPPGGGAPLPMRPSSHQPLSGDQTSAAPSRTTMGDPVIHDPVARAKTGGIKAEFERLTGLKLKVSSGYRDALGQARAMYVVLQSGGDFGKYKNKAAAAEILAAYRSAQASGASPRAIIEEMTSVIKGQMARGINISDHLTSRAIDISMKDSTRHKLSASQIGILYSVIHKFGGKVLEEHNPPHIHVKL